VWALLFAGAVFGIDRLGLGWEVGDWARPAGLIVASAGVGVAVLGVVAVVGAGTTIDPHDPSKTTALVSAGIYRLTRNPMYLGIALVLSGFGIWLENPVAAIVGTAGFVAVITRLQIIPEERMLTDRFPEAYATFRAQTRRWL
jgi:protein-S-isoprenylcysteine O-methyltransferase Ste14